MGGGKEHKEEGKAGSLIVGRARDRRGGRTL